MKRLLLLPLLLFAISVSARREKIPTYLSFVYWIQGTDTIYGENNTLLHESVSPDGTVTIRVRHEDWKNTVTDKSIARMAPSNLLARLGTPFSQLIDECGGLPADTGKIIGGGPMMGKALISLDIPMTKGSSGLLIMNEKEARRIAPEPRIRCAKCVGACPMGLEPYLLAKLGEYGDWERAENEDIMTCIECGCCTFTCPSNRPLLDWVRLAKNTVGGIIRERNMKK